MVSALCMCVFHWRTIALHSYFSYVAYRSVPRRRRRCISACDRVSAEYDRPRETRSKTTDTFLRLRLYVGVPAQFARNFLPLRERANVHKCNRLSLHVFIFLAIRISIAKISLKRSFLKLSFCGRNLYAISMKEDFIREHIKCRFIN